MAYSYRGKGPYPNKAGEFCGNHRLDEQFLCAVNEGYADAEKRNRLYLAGMHFGKPSKCKAGSSEEMAAMGFVGLYAKCGRMLYDWETAIDCEELSEEHVSTVGLPEIRAM